MKWRDVFGLMGMLFLISVMSWGYAFMTSTEMQDKTFAFIEKMKSECPSPVVCETCQPCGKQCADLIAAAPKEDVRRIYLSDRHLPDVVAYKILADSRQTEKTLMSYAQTRRKIFGSLGADDLAKLQKNNEQCSEYQIYLGIDRPYIEFTECGDTLRPKK